jgi:hypothetical protein
MVNEETITILWLEGPQAGQTVARGVAGSAIGWYYEVGSTHTVEGFGRFQVVSLHPPGWGGPVPPALR